MAYQRVILKLSGEALGKSGSAFDNDKINQTARVLCEIAKGGVQLGVVIGGGNLWRGRKAAPEMSVYAADQIGMLGTVMNCMYLCDAVRTQGQKACVQSAVEIPRFVETYSPPAALERLMSGHIVFFAGGSGNPCFSTDTPVALRAIELGCDAILMAKSIDGVYTADPHIDPKATLIKDLTYARAQKEQLGVMDLAAFDLLRRYNVPLVRVFSLDDPDNLRRVLEGDDMGTFVHP